jgi:hypothetical protein
MSDPRNAAYIGVLENDADEDMAEMVADVIYGRWRDVHGGNHDDIAFEQAIVDARHMILDEAYCHLFGGDRGGARV